MTSQFEFIKNKVLLEPLEPGAHAFATFKFNLSKYTLDLIDDIAIGQSIGAWDTSYVSESELKKKCARISSIHFAGDEVSVKLAFPWQLWHGRLSWLLTLLFGKMSFYEGLQLSDIEFSHDCFAPGKLIGPKVDINLLREQTGCEANSPLLMGILKPNVAMSAEKIAHLYALAADAGCHLVKDDEIRHDAHPTEVLKRIEVVSNLRDQKNFKTVYAVHMQWQPQIGFDLNHVRSLENAGAQALLINVWTDGLDVLQSIRDRTNLLIMAHPALVGAFGLNNSTATIHPRVTLAQMVRAAGADFSLFPSPYGKLGLSADIVNSIATECQVMKTNCRPTIPVPSAGIKPEHAPLARRDFGNNFVLNAGTAIFATGNSEDKIRSNINLFKNALYGTANS